MAGVRVKGPSHGRTVPDTGAGGPRAGLTLNPRMTVCMAVSQSRRSYSSQFIALGQAAGHLALPVPTFSGKHTDHASPSSSLSQRRGYPSVCIGLCLCASPIASQSPSRSRGSLSTCSPSVGASGRLRSSRAQSAESSPGPSKSDTCAATCHGNSASTLRKKSIDTSL